MAVTGFPYLDAALMLGSAVKGGTDAFNEQFRKDAEFYNNLEKIKVSDITGERPKMDYSKATTPLEGVMGGLEQGSVIVDQLSGKGASNNVWKSTGEALQPIGEKLGKIGSWGVNTALQAPSTAYKYGTKWGVGGPISLWNAIKGYDKRDEVKTPTWVGRDLY